MGELLIALGKRIKSADNSQPMNNPDKMQTGVTLRADHSARKSADWGSVESVYFTVGEEYWGYGNCTGIMSKQN